MAYRYQYESNLSEENDNFSNLAGRRDILQGINSVPQKKRFACQRQQSKPIPPPHPRSISGTSKANIEKPYEESLAHRKLQYTPETFEPCAVRKIQVRMQHTTT